jgi:hypothetical protein
MSFRYNDPVQTPIGRGYIQELSLDPSGYLIKFLPKDFSIHDWGQISEGGPCMFKLYDLRDLSPAQEPTPVDRTPPTTSSTDLSGPWISLRSGKVIHLTMGEGTKVKVVPDHDPLNYYFVELSKIPKLYRRG